LYKVETRGNAFKIYIGDRLVISHTPDAPFIEVGRGHWDMLGDVVRDNREGLTHLTHAQFEQGRSLLRLHGGQYSITFSIAEHNGMLRLAPQRVSTGLNRFRLRFPAIPGTAVYGGGAQMSRCNLRGHKLSLWVGERSVFQTHTPKPSLRMKGVPSLLPGCPLPVFITEGMIAYVFESYGRAAFDFTSSRAHHVSLWELPSAILIGAAPNPLELMGTVTKITGRQPVPPQWFMEGSIVEARGGSRRAAELLEKALTSGASISCIYIPDWTGGVDTPSGRRPFYDWVWNQESYPKLDGLIRELSARNIRTMAYLNPHLSIEGRLYAEASAAGYLLKKPQGGVYISDMGGFMAGHLDLTNARACSWFKDIVKQNVLELGFCGYFADRGEYLPPDAIFASGESAVRLRNRWPVLWAALNRELIREAGRTADSVFFSRFGWIGTGAQSMLTTTGQHHTSWNRSQGLPSALCSALSLSCSGIGLSVTECGGTVSYHIKRDAELYMRWMEYAAFSPSFLLANGDAQGVFIDTDPKLLAFFARLSRIHAALGTYLRNCARDNANSGAPVMRPLFMHFPTEPRFRSVNDAYMLGGELLVYPVLKKGVKSMNLYLPEGNWHHLWSAKLYNGGEHTVTVPLGKPAVFFKPDGKHAGLFEELPGKVR
jgi:alpha-glucosidase